MSKNNTVDINIKNVDAGVKNRHQQIANEKNISLNKHFNILLETQDPLNHYRKLYEETKHQNTQLLKDLQELTKNTDTILDKFKKLEEES